MYHFLEESLQIPRKVAASALGHWLCSANISRSAWQLLLFFILSIGRSYIKKPRDCFIGNSKDCLRDHRVNSLLYQTFGDSLKLSTLRAENQWQLVGFSWLHFFFLVSYKHVMELFSSPLWKTPFKSLLQPNKEVINTPRLYLFPNSFEGIFLMLYIIGDELLLKF